MIIVYYAELIAVLLVILGIWYAVIRKKVSSNVLLPVNVSECSIRKIEIELENLRNNYSLDDYNTKLLATAMKLYIAYWIIIFAAPLGIVWIMAVS